MSGTSILSSSSSPSSLPKLYGRESQLQELINVYQRTCGAFYHHDRFDSRHELPQQQLHGHECEQASRLHSTLTLITGPSGTGKTVLAQSLASTSAHDAYFVSGKFEQDYDSYTTLSKSYTPIVDAITELFGRMQKREPPASLKAFGNELQSKLTADYQLLASHLPVVASIMGLRSPMSVGGNSTTYSNSGGSATYSNNSTDTTELVLQIQQKLDGQSMSFGNNNAGGSDDGILTMTEEHDQQESTTQAVTSADGDECFRFVIRTILQIVANPPTTKPLILFIDDLQWADKESLLLIQEILLDPQIQQQGGLMLLGACRGNEVDFRGDLATLLRQLEDGGDCDVVDVQVQNLDIAQIESLIEDTLVLPTKSQQAQDNNDNTEEEQDQYIGRQLAQFTHNYTHGNAFGTKQMVELLATGLATNDTQKLKQQSTTNTTNNTNNTLYQLQTFMQEKLSKIGMTIHQNDDNLVAIVLMRLVDLKQEVQDLLQVCACLGKDFEYPTIQAILPKDTTTTHASWTIAQNLEFIQRSPKDPDKYRFAHDKLQEASYRLIPPKQRPLAHVNIGRKLWDAMDRERDGTTTSTSIPLDAELLVHQFRRGIRYVVEEEDRVRLAQLCWQASITSGIISSGGVGGSTGYLELGLSLLPRRHWRDHYHLSLGLKCAMAETSYAQGRHEETAQLVQEISQHARNLKDLARAQAILVYSLGSQNRLGEAMDASLDILKQLGEPIPQKVGMLTLLNDARRTKKELKQKPDADLLNLPHMKDPTKLAAMNILNIVFLYNFSSRPPTAALIAMRMVRRTAKDGLSAMSAVGFAAYGMILSNAFGDMQNGARCGHLALEIYEIFQKTEWYCRVHVLVWACLMPGHVPIRKCTNRMRRAGIAGLAAGDVEFAMLGVVLYTAYSIISSRDLDKLFKEGIEFYDRMKLHRQELILLWHLPLMQVISTLTGDTKTDEPAVLTGNFFNEEDGLGQGFQQSNISSLTVINYNKLTLAATMGEWAAAEEVCWAWEKYCDYSTIMVPIQDYARFLMALASLVRLRSGTKGNGKRKKRARQHLKVLRKRLQFSKENFEHRVLLLEAEQQFANGRFDLAKRKYHQAIEIAGTNLFWMEQGIAYERLASCMEEEDPKQDRSGVLEEAMNSYHLWGAKAKVQQLEWVIRNTKKSAPTN